MNYLLTMMYKKRTISSVAAMGLCLAAMAQSATDGAALMQQDIKGTARFMSMGGAFGAIGGDMTTLSYNPAGIGVYRHSEIGLSMDFDFQSTSTEFPGSKTDKNNFKYLINNGGYIGASRLNSVVMPNFNWGVTYNRRANFNRQFSGYAGHLSNSLSDYIAGVSNNSNVLEEDVITTSSFDPYQATQYPAPWISILGYDSYFISPSTNDAANPKWIGQFDSSTSGSGMVSVIEKGGIDEYNLALGGNIRNVVFWGMDFGITSLNYKRQTLWGESLSNANVDLGNGMKRYDADWDLYNDYRVNGTGFNYKLGVIVKPIQELRIGFAFHTPTWYGLTEKYYANTTFTYSRNGNVEMSNGAETNNGYDGINDFNFRTPWRFIGSIAGVFGSNLILSADVDWTGMQYMHFSAPSYSDYWYDDGWDFWPAPAKAPAKGYVSSDPYFYTNSDVKDYYQTTTTIRVGAEYRIIPQFSVRAGYAYTSSPVKSETRNGNTTIYTADPNPSYEFDNTINYASFGLGYRYQAFYVDLAYMYRARKSEWHAYSPNFGDAAYAQSAQGGPVAKVTSKDNQLVLSMGFRF